MYVLLTLGTVELLVAHLLVNLWSVTAAWVLSAITLLGIAQIVAIVRRIKRHPTILTDDGLVIRSAKGFEVALSWDRVAAVKPIGFGPAPVGDDVINAALLAHPNVHVTATRAFTVKRLWRSLTVKSFTLRVDQPDALIVTAQPYLEAGTSTERV